MLIYTTTIHVEHKIKAIVIKYIVEKHFMQLEESNLTKDYGLYKLQQQEDSEGESLSLQYKFDNNETLEAFLLLIDSKLKEELSRLYFYKVLFFSHILEKIN